MTEESRGYISPITGEVEPGIYEQGLPPDGSQKVRCWTRQRLDIVAQIEKEEKGEAPPLMLVKSTIRDDVFDWIDPASEEYRRRIGDAGNRWFGQ
jgi:hypothetical protein